MLLPFSSCPVVDESKELCFVSSSYAPGVSRHLVQSRHLLPPSTSVSSSSVPRLCPMKVCDHVVDCADGGDVTDWLPFDGISDFSSQHSRLDIAARVTVLRGGT